MSDKKEYSWNPVEGIPELAHDVEKVFSEENFPDVDPGWLDASRHFFGQAYSTSKYGYALTRGAGIYNEYDGFFRQGQTRRPVQDDFHNNREGRNFYYKNESVPYLTIIENAINDPKTLTKSAKDSLMSVVTENAIYGSDFEQVEDLSRWNRYSMERIMQFLKDADLY